MILMGNPQLVVCQTDDVDLVANLSLEINKKNTFNYVFFGMEIIFTKCLAIL